MPLALVVLLSLCFVSLPKHSALRSTFHPALVQIQMMALTAVIAGKPSVRSTHRGGLQRTTSLLPEIWFKNATQPAGDLLDYDGSTNVKILNNGAHQLRDQDWYRAETHS